eukprot:CAMPEP_0183759308 /NCGR_PEP_ID=MMETSP0739-20130205/7010_1 /TAXON_ID=385413 /ORGANISM="Thalassiosira miniscula, Strain CCMP1093" /LENGTH=402 /DNA_ID=CAMNT_0025997073 /DNA_START=13 /DNA_END=1221 /DNA_ORIENTATION=+
MATTATTRPRNATTDGKVGRSNANNTSSSGQEWILDAYSSLEPRSYLQEFTSQNVRPDGRPFSASRPITVLPSIFARNSHGSAMITLGGRGSEEGKNASSTTRVVAACTLLVGHPSPSTPDEGDIDVTLTASPLSGPRFDIAGRENGEITSGNYGSAADGNNPQSLPGNLSHVIDRNHHNLDAANTTPSPTDTKEIESWVRRTLRSSRYVNPRELGIEHGMSAWRVRISIHILNHEGNVWDAALLAACAALKDLRLPMVEIGERGVVKMVMKEQQNDGNHSNNGKKVKRREGRSLTLGPLPVPLTIAILPNDNNNKTKNSDDETINSNNNNKQPHLLVADPTHLEEDVSSGNSVTVVCNAKEEIVEFHKKGSGSRLSVEQVAAVAVMGFGRAKELERLVLGR